MFSYQFQGNVVSVSLYVKRSCCSFPTENCTFFNFQKSLINFGIEKTLVSEWLVIRKNKKLTNTQTSFNAIQREISKSNKTPNECIKIAVEKNWGGFEAAWLQNIKTNNNNKTGITNLTGDEVYEQF